MNIRLICNNAVLSFFYLTSTFYFQKSDVNFNQGNSEQERSDARLISMLPTLTFVDLWLCRENSPDFHITSCWACQAERFFYFAATFGKIFKSLEWFIRKKKKCFLESCIFKFSSILYWIDMLPNSTIFHIKMNFVNLQQRF